MVTHTNRCNVRLSNSLVFTAFFQFAAVGNALSGKQNEIKRKCVAWLIARLLRYKDYS